MLFISSSHDHASLRSGQRSPQDPRGYFLALYWISHSAEEALQAWLPVAAGNAHSGGHKSSYTMELSSWGAGQVLSEATGQAHGSLSSLRDEVVTLCQWGKATAGDLTS